MTYLQAIDLFISFGNGRLSRIRCRHDTSVEDICHVLGRNVDINLFLLADEVLATGTARDQKGKNLRVVTQEFFQNESASLE